MVIKRKSVFEMGEKLNFIKLNALNIQRKKKQTNYICGRRKRGENRRKKEKRGGNSVGEKVTFYNLLNIPIKKE